MRFFIGAALATWIGLALMGMPQLQAASPAADLPAVARAAKGHFEALGADDLARSKAHVLAAIAKLNARLATAGPEAADWRAFVMLEGITAEMAKPQPAMPVLEKAFARLSSGNEGLNLIWFAELRQALRSYLAVVQAMSDAKTKDRYEVILEGLAKRLAELPQGVSSEEAVWIGNALRWLDDTGQAQTLVHAVRGRCNQANLLAQVSARLVGAGIERPIDEMTPVRDCILGTDIHGTGHTVGKVIVKLAPNNLMAILDTYFIATVDSQSVGYNGPAIIHTVGTTQLEGIKRLWITDQGVNAHPAVSDAQTSSIITGIGSTKGRAIVERIASRRASAQKCEAEAIASEHAECRVNERMDRESAGKLEQANQRYADRFRTPLTERNLFPAELRFSTCEKYLNVRAQETDAYHLGAPLAAPPALANVDMAVRVHQSALNNLTDKALGGMTVRDETLQSILKDLLGHVPEEFKPDENDQPWAITFAADVPITFDFLDNQFRITVRGRRFIRGENSYPAMDVTVVYKIVHEGGVFKAVRQGNLEIFPPDFVPGKGARLSGRQLVIRDLIARRFGKVFKEELVGKGIDLPGNWKKGGRLMPSSMTCRDGWMSIGWVQVAAPAPAKTAQR
jgi:hypothetical protein